MTGAEMVFKALEDQGVRHIFGYPGGAVLPIYDELKNHKKIKHILVRHEQGAGHAAEGYARSSGKPGVILVTSGPGATNTVTALTDAYMDSVPLVCITGQVPTHLIGTDAFQECDTTGITRPCTKHNWLVKDIEKLSSILHKAFEVATSGRPGPVLVDIPKDIQFAKGKYVRPKELKNKNGKSNLKFNGKDIETAVDFFKKSSKPILYTGGGVINSGPRATQLLRELVSLTGFPITSTLQGLGAFPGYDQQFLGMLGMHGTFEANNAMHDCDLMINIGARFDDRITGKIDEFSPKSKKIHIDIDPKVIGANYKTHIALIADAKLSLIALNEKIKKNDFNGKETVQAAKQKKFLEFNKLSKINNGLIKPERIVHDLNNLLPENSYIVVDPGTPCPYFAAYYKFSKSGRYFVTNRAHGALGYALPASIGVQIGKPKNKVVSVMGDGSFGFAVGELETAVRLKLPIIFIVIFRVFINRYVLYFININ